MDALERWFVRFVCVTCTAIVAHIQSHQILVVTAKSCDIIAEFNEIDYLVAVLALLVHSDICIAGHAVIWWPIQFRRWNTAHQF